MSAALRPDQPGQPRDWRAHLLESPAQIAALLRRVQRVAVLGIKPRETMQPAYFVPQYAQQVGLEVVPVPVYYPELTEMLGAPVYRRLADVPGHIDLVNVFRRPADVPAHLDDILAARPGAVWLQSGIRHAETAERLAREGIDVVQDRCLMVELRTIGM
ncbi:CoA-binding protein [Roseisolibacter sp. H3M3-2]|uniref:CoA-binding protein n=1 Tax=Roseisolibacter sp. H3M3-2 TaxID=3031323 RepID=UPI0023DA78B5|nr:CoA-binding protein [Roseisolibacter sp. H3M3-2]MDF1501678.1 CoA-binding protein [Roseisolibacter sp. H3M3-2]